MALDVSQVFVGQSGIQVAHVFVVQSGAFSLNGQAGTYTLTGGSADLLYIPGATSIGGYAYERRIRRMRRQNRDAEEVAVIMAALFDFLA